MTRRPAASRSLDRRAHFGAHGDAFGMHAMLGEIVDAHRLKSPGSDVQRHERRAHSHFAATREHRFVEVQTGRRRGDRAGLARIDRLIARRIVRFCRPRDVRRQRHRAVLFEVRQRIGAELQLEQIVAATDVVSLHAAGQRYRHVAAQRFARVRMREDAASFEHALEQDLHLPACGLAADDARRNYARIVEHEQVAGAQQRRQIREAQIVHTRSLRAPNAASGSPIARSGAAVQSDLQAGRRRSRRAALGAHGRLHGLVRQRHWHGTLTGPSPCISTRMPGVPGIGGIGIIGIASIDGA